PLRRAVRRGGGDEALLTGGRVLSLGQRVDLVVLDDVGQVDVAAAGMDEVVAADAVGVAVAVHHQHRHLGVGQAEAGGHRQRPTVDGHEAVGVDVVGQFRAAADAADDHDLVGRDAQVGQGFLDGGEDGVVAAAGTPRGPVLAVKVFGRDAGGSA